MDQLDFYEQLTVSIKQMRKRSGLSQKALAEYAGVGKSVVFDIEHGKKTVQINSVLKICSVLNIKLHVQNPMSS